MLSDTQEATIDAVLDYYGGMGGRRLSELTHSEAPWREAREGLADDDPGEAVISRDTMRNTYTVQSIHGVGPRRFGGVGEYESLDRGDLLDTADTLAKRWGHTLELLAQ
ncbi:Panacea domain-containing protein [Cutibacterium sp.]|uniref:Panacea domain-containing protein n=1 Tax=Cutibacterium sp. TaxID=1912221 RepID=UPI0026DC2A0D|nr:type II toxin-antitoxin system antitoxin SocA domain-containing protein [Cutibacterium sp.]MDO4412925.1 DUF4065 domain-containing protein [Cutibacterium sp.]